MKLPATVADFAEVDLAGRPLFLAIGMFDGVHLGHQAVIESAVHCAASSDGVAGVLTFHPHPSRLFRPDDPTLLLMPPNLKARRLRALGVSLLIQKEFTRDFGAIPADDFLPHLKRALPTLRSVHVGENFRFGKGRAGDIEALVVSGKQHGIGVFSAERLRWNGEAISSTRIRSCLREGQIEEANALLGYPYFAEGAIVPGEQRGRALGFPTLNFDWSPELQPRHGVYAVRVRAEKIAVLPGVANYGLRPTFGEAATPRLEVHVLVETTLQLGDQARVDWLAFLRDEQTFPNPDALRAQIRSDVQAARTKLGL